MFELLLNSRQKKYSVWQQLCFGQEQKSGSGGNHKIPLMGKSMFWPSKFRIWVRGIGIEGLCQGCDPLSTSIILED
jgi:hypothetical protein